MSLRSHILADLPVDRGGVPAFAFAWAAANAWEHLTELGPDSGAYPTRIVATSDVEGLAAVHVSGDGGSSAYGVTVRLDDDVFIVESSACGVHVDGRMRQTIPVTLAPEFTWSLGGDGGRDGRTRDRTMLDDIFGVLDGNEWDSETMTAVAAVFTDNGWTLRGPDDE